MLGAYADSAPTRCAEPCVFGDRDERFDRDRHVDRFIRKRREHVGIRERHDLDVGVAQTVGREIEAREEIGDLAARGDGERHAFLRLERSVGDEILARDEELRVAGRRIFRGGEEVGDDRHLRTECERVEERGAGRRVGDVDLAGRERGHQRRAGLEEDRLQIDAFVFEEALFDADERRLRHAQESRPSPYRRRGRARAATASASAHSAASASERRRFTIRDPVPRCRSSRRSR